MCICNERFLNSSKGGTCFSHCTYYMQGLSSVLRDHREQASEYTHYSDPNHAFRTALQSILLNTKKEDLLDILSVYLVNSNAKVDYCVVGKPPLHVAIEVSTTSILLRGCSFLPHKYLCTCLYMYVYVTYVPLHPWTE